MAVPLLDLKAQFADIRDEVLCAVAEVLDSQVCIGGPKVDALEQKIAEFCGAQYGVGVSSGTDALLAVLMALGVGPGDEVITTPYTFFATAGCIARLGATPVFVDIEPTSYNIDSSKIEAAVTSRTKALVPVHLFGQSCEIDSIVDIAKIHGIQVVEDAAQAIGSTYKHKKVGAFGCAGCFSFFPSKNLGCAGDGGMIVTNDVDLRERLRMLRTHGAKPKYHHKVIGGNFRLDAIQAAILLTKLPFLAEWSERRRQNAHYYDSRFAGSEVTAPVVRDECVSIYNQYVIRVDRRDELIAHLKSKGIGAEVYYPVPLHLQECFHYLGYQEGSFPEAERASRETLALPIYPELTEQMLEYVADCVLEVVGCGAGA